MGKLGEHSRNGCEMGKSFFFLGHGDVFWLDLISATVSIAFLEHWNLYCTYLFFLVYNLNCKVPLGSFCSKNDLRTSVEKIKAIIVQKAIGNEENNINLAPPITFYFVSVTTISDDYSVLSY